MADDSEKTPEVESGDRDSLSGTAWAESILADDASFAEYSAELFSEYDQDKNGRLGKGTAIQILNEVCKDHGISPPKSKKIQELFQKCDKDRNGALDNSEFALFFKVALANIVQRVSVIGGASQ